MEKALYSVLRAGKNIDIDQCRNYLGKGIKVLCFLPADEKKSLQETDYEFLNNPYFKLYENPNGIEAKIIDGRLLKNDDLKLCKLAEGDPAFNREQFLVEHADKNNNLCVEAGAGTGKTTVMIDRIMFLFHTDANFSFEKVAMITFTNKATDNMRHKLLSELSRRYSITHDLKYLRGLEEVSQVSISTIHSFFRRIIIEVGPLMGYGTNLQMRSFAKEKKEILRKILNDSYGNSNRKVDQEFGLRLYEIESLAGEYWDKMENNGLTDDEIQNLTWGKNKDKNVAKIQKQLKNIFEQVEDEYNRRKLEYNAISMKDIIHELGKVVHLEEAKEYITSSFDYIFCDEFQDTDIVQIKTIALLAQIYDSRLFVVGDIKQSIYRFRGATDAAFQNLIERAVDIEFEPASLVKNYRTSKDIMDRLDAIFARWNEKQYIRYEKKDRLVPRNLEAGEYQQIKVTNKNRKEIVLKKINEIMSADPSAIVTILARTNKELQEVRLWCSEVQDLAVQIKEKGSFFSSAAVLDMCAMLEGLLYDSVPMYVWELYNTSYVEKVADIDIAELRDLEGSTYKVLEKIYQSLNKKQWDKYRSDIKKRPVLAVLREIIEECKPVERYAASLTEELRRREISEETIFTQVTLDTRTYKANLDKLLQMLQDTFSSDFCSLYDVSSFLRIRIETDTEEEQALIDRKTEKGYVEGFTVHSAKGLEFDYVFIPFMKFPFVSDFRSEILISENNEKVGWVYRKKDNNDVIEYVSENYVQMKETENEELIRDETRLLYVAMTRAIKGLYCFPTRRWEENGVNDWSGLLAKEYDNA